MSRQFRSLVFRLHTWLGLHVFLIMALLLLSGTLLIFIAQIEAGLDQGRRITAPLAVSDRPSFGTLYDHLRAEAPDAQLILMERAHSDWIADRARTHVPGEGKRYFWFEGDGEVSHRSSYTDIRLVLFQFHSSFLTETGTGNLLLTAFAVPLTLFTVTGMITYRRFWRGFFRLPSAAAGARGWWGGLHRLLAVWSLPFLIAMSVTSLYYFAGSLGFVAEHHPSYSPPAERAEALPEGFDGAALDRAFAAAQAAAPDLVITHLAFPGDETQGIIFWGEDDTALTGGYANEVIIDPLTMAVLGLSRAGDLPFSTRLTEANEALHFGEWGGFPTEVLWLIFGALSTMLCFAGAMVYASRIVGPDVPGGAARRIWRGMSVIKWLLPLFIIGVVAAGLLRLA